MWSSVVKKGIQNKVEAPASAITPQLDDGQIVVKHVVNGKTETQRIPATTAAPCLICHEEICPPDVWVKWPCGHSVCGSCNFSYIEYHLTREREVPLTTVKCPLGFCEKEPGQSDMIALIGFNSRLLTLVQTRLEESAANEISGQAVGIIEGGEAALEAVNDLNFRKYLEERSRQLAWTPKMDLRAGLCWRCKNGWESAGVAHVTDCMCWAAGCTCKELNKDHIRPEQSGASDEVLSLGDLEKHDGKKRLDFGSALADFVTLMKTSKQASVAALGEVLASSDVRACPFCLHIIERSIGCDHMHCTRCRRDFDWSTVQTTPGDSVVRALEVSRRERQATAAAVKNALRRVAFRSRVDAIFKAGSPVKDIRTDLGVCPIPAGACPTCFRSWEREQNFNHAITCGCRCACGHACARWRNEVPSRIMATVRAIMMAAPQQQAGVLPWKKFGAQAAVVEGRSASGKSGVVVADPTKKGEGKRRARRGGKRRGGQVTSTTTAAVVAV